jgi:class 3 adenylate cyclase
VSAEPELAGELAAVIDRRLPADPQRGVGMRSLDRMRSALSSLTDPGAVDDVVRVDIAALLGLDLGELAEIAARVAKSLEVAGRLPAPNGAMPALIQAYARGVGRIATAEADMLADMLSGTAPGDRAQLLDRVLKALVPAGNRAFELIRAGFLRDALLVDLASPRTPAAGTEPLAIAMVDLVGSTSYLQRTGPRELQQLVDVLFEAAQSATVGRGPSVVKYVGDGVFLSARDAVELAEVAVELTEMLEEGLPLRARGGLSYGAVVHHAGDVFGLPVNTALILSKAAAPGAVVAEEAVAMLLPDELRGPGRTVMLPHPALGETRIWDVQPRSGLRSTITP